MIRKLLVGVVAVSAIFFSITYIGNFLKNYEWLEYQTAAVIQSQLSGSTKKAQNNTISSQELYSIIKHLNNEIEKTLSTVKIKAVNSADQKNTSSEAVLKQDQSQNTKIETSDMVKGATVGPVDQVKLQRQLVQRKNFLIMLAKSDPRLFLLSGLSESTKTKIPNTNRAELETDTTITGVIEVIHIDDFEKHENSRFEYFLRVGKERLSLYPTSNLFVSSGGTFRVKGKKIGDSVVADIKDIKSLAGLGGQEDGPGATARPPESVGEQKTLALLIRFQDSPPPPVSREEAYDLIFNDQFQEFYKEQSYGKTHFSGKVMGWYSLPRNCNNQAPEFPYPGSETANLIIDNSIDLSKYDRLLLIAQAAGSLTCGNFGGWGTVGKVPITLDGVTYRLSVGMVNISPLALSQNWNNHIEPPRFNGFDYVLSHEIGHNLGVMHGNGLDCDDQTLIGECVNREYGNFFDNMGYGFFGLHFNAFYKERLGWISPQNSILITESGRYTINHLEIQKSGQKNLAKIQTINSGSKPFYLEFRKGIGFDRWLNQNFWSSNQSGLFVNFISPGPVSQYSFTSLLDMQPTSLTWGADLERSTLNVGNEFTDEATGITIGPVIESNNSSITFDVSIEEPECVRNGHSLLGINDPQIVGTGISYSIQIPFKNEDSEICDESEFDVVQTGIPNSWNPVIIPLEGIILSPGSVGSKNINLSVPLNAQLGMYPVTYTVINETAGNTSSDQINLQIVQSPIIENIQPESGSTGTVVVISGLNFSLNPQIMMYGSEGFFFAYPTSNGSWANFQVPAFITGYNCNCLIPTPLGLYNIYIGVNGVNSNQVQFEVTP